MRLVEQIQPVFSISYHSYSELVLYPYGCNGQRAEAYEVIEPIGQNLAGRLRSDDGQGTYAAGTSWEVLYSVDGSDIDWMYGEHHVLPYVIEVSSDNQGFQPPYSWRQSTVERQRPGWGYLLDRLDGSGIHGVVLNSALEPRPDIPVVVTKLEGSPTGASLGQIVWSEPIQSVSKKDGSFHVVLAPGAYRVTFGSGQSQVFRDVMVGDQRVDFNMMF
jgi:hypothetical protein